MNTVVRLATTVFVGLVFAGTIANAEPYPNAHGTVLFLAALVVFVAVGVLTRGYEHSAWLLFGASTFVCYGIPAFWFWFGAMERGWWYPPQLPIVQQFMFIYGESAYDAQVSNAFLVLWAFVGAFLAARFLVARQPGGASET